MFAFRLIMVLLIQSATSEHSIRQLARQTSILRNATQFNIDNPPTWNQTMRIFRRKLIDHHHNHGRRLNVEESTQCLEHFQLTEREVRLSLIGHTLYDMKLNAPIKFQELLTDWIASGKPIGKMYDWSKGTTYQGELQLLAHACLKTVMLMEDGSQKIWDLMDRLERDYVAAQWIGIIEKDRVVDL